MKIILTKVHSFVILFLTVFLVMGFAFPLRQASATLSGEVKDCFGEHLREAIRINRERRPLYQQATGGDSSKISSMLVTMEKISLVVASWMQSRASSYQANGIPLLCADFMSMSLTPSFVSSIPVDPKVSSAPYESVGAYSVMTGLFKAHQQGGFLTVRDLAEARIQSLSNTPQYHCLFRHFLESIARAAHLAPQYEKQALEKGLASSGDISWSYIRLQILALPYVSWVDDVAAPIQARGIPMVCHDVPSIPTRPNL